LPHLVSRRIEDIYRDESRRVFATLIRLLGDFDLAEDALHDAFAAALAQWPRDGVPTNPRAWLITTGRFKALDTLRRRVRFEAALPALAAQIDDDTDLSEHWDDEGTIEDDQLRLIFTCCHPALSADARVALTLREVCGLTTEEIARAFLLPATTLAQRIVRAKAKIRAAGIPYRVPELEALPDRIGAIHQVIYLVFTEGYSASSGDMLTRPDLSSEAIRLARLLNSLLPDPETGGLLALMLLHESRRLTRTSPSGDLVLLENQDRALWNRHQISEGQELVEEALKSRRFGPYTLQAAIAAVHSEAATPTDTDWEQIVELYDVLTQVAPSPIIALNRAVAVSMRDGPLAGLMLIDSLLLSGDLLDYYLAHSARAELCRQLGRTTDALMAYERAIALTEQGPEQRFLKRRIDELKAENK